MIDGLLSQKDALDAARGVRGTEEVTEALARVAWSVIADPGDAVAATLVREFGPADGLRFALDGAGRSWPVVRAVGARRALDDARARWRQRADPEAVIGALRGARKAGVNLLLPGDPDWPLSVDDLDAEAPMVLWVRGHSDLLTSAARVAIVGARAATAYGERVAADIAGDLAVGETAVVSGGANFLLPKICCCLPGASIARSATSSLRRLEAWWLVPDASNTPNSMWRGSPATAMVGTRGRLACPRELWRASCGCVTLRSGTLPDFLT